MAKNTPSAASIEASKRLKKAWNEKRKVLNLSQTDAGNLLDISQGAVGQYLNGIISLNLTILIKFCALISEDPSLIYPEMMDQIKVNNGPLPDQSNTKRELMEKIGGLSEESAATLLAMTLLIIEKAK